MSHASQRVPDTASDVKVVVAQHAVKLRLEFWILRVVWVDELGHPQATVRSLPGDHTASGKPVRKGNRRLRQPVAPVIGYVQRLFDD